MKSLRRLSRQVSKLEKEKAFLQSLNNGRIAKKQAVIDSLRTDLKKKTQRGKD